MIIKGGEVKKWGLFHFKVVLLMKIHPMCSDFDWNEKLMLKNANLILLKFFYFVIVFFNALFGICCLEHCYWELLIQKKSILLHFAVFMAQTYFNVLALIF